MVNRTNLLAPETYNIVQEIEAHVSKDKFALIWESEQGDVKKITYKNLIENANKIANVMKNFGLKKGDTVLVIVPRLIAAYETYIALLKSGMVIIPSSELLRPKDLQYRIQHGDVKGIVSYIDFADLFTDIEEAKNLPKFVIGGDKEKWINLQKEMEKQSAEFPLVATSKDDLAFISYTSGTTGNPKGVVHVHAWGYAHLRTAAKDWLGIEENDIVWGTAGPGWAKWVWTPFLSVLGSGATGFVYYGKFDPRKYLELLSKYEINVICCTPTEYRFMAKVDHLEKFKLPKLRSAVSAGEPLNREVIETFQKYFQVNVRDGYGQTENSLLVGITKDMKLKPGSMGKPTPGNRIDIINEEGKPCAVGEVGDIAVHIESPALFKYYYKDPERTKMQFRGDYFITGDKAKKDEEGYFWFEGRGDDIIISSGYTIGPFEVEDALVKHPFVRECAVVASPDEIRGQVVKAFVVLKERGNYSDEELIEMLQNHVKNLTAPSYL